MSKIIEIAHGTQQVEISLSISADEFNDLVDLNITAQDPDGVVTSLILPKSQVINSTLKFPFIFSKNGDYTMQATLNFTSKSITDVDALVLRVINPVKNTTLIPQGKYINKNDINVYLEQSRLVNLSDRRNGETSDNPKIQQAIEFAESLAESYISRVYKLPLLCANNSAPTILKQRLIEIAVFNMFEQRATEEVKFRYDQAIGFLSDVASGKALLMCSDGLQLAKAGASTASTGVFAASYQQFEDCGCDYARAF